MKHLKLFKDTASYDVWKASDEFVLPNVVFNEETETVVFDPFVAPTSPNVVAVYNVTDISRETQILDPYGLRGFSSMIINGVKMDADIYYQFDTVGKHVVEFVLNDPTRIAWGSFKHCTNLTAVTIPDSVIDAGGDTFYKCSSLSSITCYATTAPRCSYSTICEVSNGGILYVPTGSDYSSWMSTGDYYLGKYNWTIEYI